jgi:hypothetical protein
VHVKTTISTGYNIGFKSLNIPVTAEPPTPDIDEERSAPATPLVSAAEPATVLVARLATTSVPAFDTRSPTCACKDKY